MQRNSRLLIVEDDQVNREMLKAILEDQYVVLEADNGRDALEIVKQRREAITAVLSDIVMPVMDGFELLDEIKKDELLSTIPFIIMTDNGNDEEGLVALRRGAWDFITYPYNPEIIKMRLENAIARSRLIDTEKLHYRARRDILTGAYTREAFFDITKTTLANNPTKKFIMVYSSIERFPFITAYYGEKEGDSLVKYIAGKLDEICHKCDLFTYARVESDVFCFCMEYSDGIIEFIVKRFRFMLEKYGADYDLEPNFGIYIIEDNSMSIERIYNNAALAAKEGENQYLNYYTIYTGELDERLKNEQKILNDMHKALENDEFIIYMQPKYNVYTNKIVGAEALVRWQHPDRGLISPGTFIPVFEKNGFIAKLDYYVWEKTCQILRNWIDEGIDPNPISVNISQVDIYNTNLAQNIIRLSDKYNIPHRLLELEITESSYGNNPEDVIKVVDELRKNGFTILMDDFGNAYSSLNLLKDIEIDVLKLDMRFLSDTKKTGRSENIIASVIRMAKWLHIDVIVEGVEEARQAEFLRTVGCNYAQGYYYCHPVAVSEYETIVLTNKENAGNKNCIYYKKR